MNTYDSESFDQRIDPARLRNFMRTYLKLAADATDEEIRAALFKRDDGLLAWFDSRRDQEVSYAPGLPIVRYLD